MDHIGEDALTQTTRSADDSHVTGAWARLTILTRHPHDSVIFESLRLTRSSSVPFGEGSILGLRL
jgi:hypothetical protein